MSEAARLSKSQYVRGLQCHKALWLYRKRKDLLPDVAAPLQMIFDQGHSVGVLAHQRFPGGLLIAEDHLHSAEAVAATDAAVAAGAVVLYEAGVIFENVLIRADVLVRNEDKSWDLIEVKSSTAVKDVYLSDVAVQRFVLEGAGYKIRKTILLHLNNQYVRTGALDVNELFTAADVTSEAGLLLASVPTYLKAMQSMLRDPNEPAIDIGPHCQEPYPCEFSGYCWEHVPDYSVFDLAGARFEKKTQLWRQGVRTVADIPADFKLTSAQALQVAAARSGRAHKDKAAIAALLKELVFPLHFLDFETVNFGVPPYDGLRPFQQLPFQASVHIQDHLASPLRHAEYLDDGRQDPRPGMVAFLAGEIGPKGTIIAYNKGFEGMCLDELGLLSLKGRLWDLADPFRKGCYVHPGFEGSWSIKKVLPVLVPTMTYAHLVIHDGPGAQTAYMSLMSGKLDAGQRRATMKHLKEYCGQDTLAMVEILKVLSQS